MIPYSLSKLAIALLSPLGTALALLLLSVVLGSSKRIHRWPARTCLALALAWLWLWSTPAVSQQLLSQVESPFPPQLAKELPPADAIVIAGGAMDPPSRAAPYADLGPAADRVWHAARIFKAGKASWILASGGSDPAVSRESEAESMRTLLADLGVPPDRVQVEGRSRTTQENADFSAPILATHKARNILLVTSALHMRRAVAEFERIGVKVIPAATDHSQPRSGIQNWLPEAAALHDSGRAIKELAGRWALQFRPQVAVQP